MLAESVDTVGGLNFELGHSRGCRISPTGTGIVRARPVVLDGTLMDTCPEEPASRGWYATEPSTPQDAVGVRAREYASRVRGRLPK